MSSANSSPAQSVQRGGGSGPAYTVSHRWHPKNRRPNTPQWTGGRVDILPGLKGEDSHARTALDWEFQVRGGARIRVRDSPHRGAVSTGHVKWPLLLSSERRFPSFPRGFRRSSADSEVPVSLPVPTYPDGVPSRFSRMHPNLSDCPGMGADGPRRMDTETFRWPLNLSNRTFGTDDGDPSPPSRVGLSPLQSCKDLFRAALPQDDRTCRVSGSERGLDGTAACWPAPCTDKGRLLDATGEARARH